MGRSPSRITLSGRAQLFSSATRSAPLALKFLLLILFLMIMNIFLEFLLIVMKGTGLSAKECEICDFFVYIPQYGCGTASLNVTVAASIVLHHFGGNFYFLLLSRSHFFSLY